MVRRLLHVMFLLLFYLQETFFSLYRYHIITTQLRSQNNPSVTEWIFSHVVLIFHCLESYSRPLFLPVAKEAWFSTASCTIGDAIEEALSRT